ncbi:hypothetical protein M2451_003400 [Dysgonomonas sp. PFB1-18]|nr:hypothetical protein [Dysgonomonas sp. PF1-14]MDH6340360.1 hypothetical protein [Dysgonomonas sp. PF1-16]MDH6382060.1 hypothetical protein [Dysgonomonas sp. PFB1-18]MDH6399331.1 hypothetical protein [Dysgonomonas sp. PF1-23]
MIKAIAIQIGIVWAIFIIILIIWLIRKNPFFRK